MSTPTMAKPVQRKRKQEILAVITVQDHLATRVKHIYSTITPASSLIVRIVQEKDPLTMATTINTPPQGNFFTFLSLGQVFARTFSIFVDRLDVFLTISGLVHLPAIILTVVVVLALAPVNDETHGNHGEFIHEHWAAVLTIIYMQMLVSS